MRHSTDRRPATPAALPAAVPTVVRRAAIEASVEAHNCAHPTGPLPQSATRLLVSMFPLSDEFTGSQETLAQCRVRQQAARRSAPGPDCGRSAVAAAQRPRRTDHIPAAAVMSAWFSRLKREREAHNITAAQYLVLCELGRFDRCRLGIFPSHRTLAARARCCVRTVQNALQTARRLGLVEWAATRARAAWRSLQGPNRYVLKVPGAAVQWVRRTGGKFCRGDTNGREKPACERSGGAIRAMLEAARGLPDLLAARAGGAKWRPGTRSRPWLRYRSSAPEPKHPGNID